MARKPSKNQGEEQVSDTATTEAKVDPTASTEPVSEATPTPAPEPKVEIDHAGNLYNAIVGFASDSDVAKLQEAYRAVPAAARGKVQGVAMKQAMTEGNVDMEVLGSVLDAFNSLPAATKTTRTKVEVDPKTANAIRLAGLMAGYERVKAELAEAGDEAQALATEWINSGTPEANAAAIEKIAVATVAASNKGGGRGGSGGPRNAFKQTLAQLVEAGAVPAGATLTGSNDAEAIVNEDGSVTSNGEKFDNLSAAARAHRKQKDGKETSTNGWDFWNYDGKPVGGLRTF